jgi:hypothetical protein
MSKERRYESKDSREMLNGSSSCLALALLLLLLLRWLEAREAKEALERVVCQEMRSGEGEGCVWAESG